MRFFLLLVICLCVALPALADGKMDMNEGSIALRKGDFTTAIVHLSAAIDSGELGREATAVMRISRAQALYHLEEYQQAADDLTVAVESGAINDSLVGIALATRASAYREMGDLPFAIGFGVGGLLVYAWYFRPDWSVVGIGIAETTPEATDDSTDEESETPE